MSKNHFHEIRTNTNYSVDYETTTLVPQVELIFLCANPAYQIVKKGKERYIEKGHELVETRINVSLEDLNNIIGQLQATAVGLQTFDQLASGLNAMIAEAKKSMAK